MAAQKRTNNSSASNYELMETIRKYPVIYDKNSDDQLEKKDAWTTVAEEAGIDVAEAQLRYGNVRTVFSRYLKGLRRRRSGGETGKLGGDIRLKEEFEYLRWLIGYIKPRNCDSRKTKRGSGDHGGGDYDSSDDEYGDEVVDGGGDMWTDLLKEAIAVSESYKTEGSSERRQDLDCITPGTSSLTPKSSKGSGTPKHGGVRTHPRSHHKKAKSEGRAPWSTMKLLAGARQASMAGTSVQQDDEDMMFCLGLAPKMRRLPERFKTAAQLRILQVICEYEVAEPSPPQPPPPIKELELKDPQQDM